MQAHDRSPRPLPIRAAQYVRMSTEHQQYSIENQLDAIARYAKEHVMEVVRTYTDDGKSGLNIQNRAGLQQLIQDVEDETAGVSAILVYDVSRWGRFQDADESAYYEYRCRRANINVHYCAEPFANDGSVSSALLKTLKRTMAGEFSRELSVKVFAGMCRLAELGFRQGGRTGYGLRRLLIDPDGKPKTILTSGQYKSISTDRVVLIPGPPEEVEVVREIYRRWIDTNESMAKIAAALNQRAITNEIGGPWTRYTVSEILTNPKYMGSNVTNRISFKLQRKRVPNPPEMWVRRDGAFQPVVSAETFKRAQDVLAECNRRYTNDELLELLKGLLSRRRELTGAMINDADGVPCARLYRERFGGLLEAYRRIGYTPPRDYSFRDMTEAIKSSHKERVATLVADLRHTGATVSLDEGADLLTVNNEVHLRYLTVRCCRDGYSGRRWFFNFDLLPSADITIAARMSVQNDSVMDYYVVPRCERLKRVIYNGNKGSSFNVYRFADLSVLTMLISRTRLTEDT